MEKGLDVSEQESKAMNVLIQNELFSDEPHGMTRDMLCDALKVGRKKAKTITDHLEQIGLVAHRGQRPAFYRLSDDVRRRVFDGTGKDVGE